ncbi:SGNH/GDSL hydrolase family protein [Paenibacillus sp. CF384]|uniref:SGNH/GDSL hydrolase family protein n=1 Tax=Paenibacillus sp. CF384 TaxID=1884382 RepID=UPI00089D13D0|nr:SGNH/GDSL hydrolase family protein [Paenibacillus sp. CF384]SDW05840.1 GDSL-like Lipase/Acylhydrolase family protein [Paenibacillus sp. CF384]
MKPCYSGLAVVSSKPASLNVIVEPGWMNTGIRMVELIEPVMVSIREAGQRSLVDQIYRMQGEGTSSPSGWNGEDIRGSGGMPYQRMVPGSLHVYSKDRNRRYLAETDYTHDSYWGSIKRHPQGGFDAGEELSLDYAVWLCRYDAIVLLEDGTIRVFEGDCEAPESRELLLPEPPEVREGYVLAHVFTGWGQNRVYGGGSVVSNAEHRFASVSQTVPRLIGRYEDMEEREYVIEVSAVADEEGYGRSYQARIAASGADYGMNDSLTADTWRWTEHVPMTRDRNLPLLLQTAYRFPVSWGLELDFSPLWLEEDGDPSGTFYVQAYPEMIFDRRTALNGSEPLTCMPLEQREHLDGFREKLAAGTPVRIAFFGASNARSGLWPSQVIKGLREAYPQTKISTSSITYGGEEMRHGRHRFRGEVVPVAADLIIIEYFINDVCHGNPEETEVAARYILQSIRDENIPCMLLTNNGANPLFSRYASSANFQKYHDLYRSLAAEYGVAFVGGYSYFRNLHEYGKYFITELKGNMINHPYGFADRNWGQFDPVISTAILRMIL